MPEKRTELLVAPVPTGEKSEFPELAQLAAQVGDGRLLKMEYDYTKDVDAALPNADILAKSRLGSDMKSNARVVQHMVQMCFDGKQWDLLNETILALSKKRLLIKVAIARMVRSCCQMVEKMPTEELRMKLIETLRTVTAGKIYVEVERARLTSYVVKKLEAQGKLEEAATMLLELQVETYGSMEVKERVEFLLEQMRLSVAREDYVRASIIAKKISTKFFTKEPVEDQVQNLKLKFYELMITVGLHNNNYLDVCRHYRAIQETPKILGDLEKNKMALKCAVIYVLLAPHGNEQWDLVHRLVQMRDLESILEYKKFLELFINQEIISWTELGKTYQALLRVGTPANPATGIFDDSANGNKRWEDLHVRVGEHNLRMVSKYYTQITFDRLAELLDFPVAEMEQFLCNLIVNGMIPNAKIDRPNRIVNLKAKKAHVDHLDQWADNVRRLTDTLNKVSHLILKEEMVHKNLEQVSAIH
ncbi:unnamed protein product, partial [Mesorhabditis spiculigera]